MHACEFRFIQYPFITPMAIGARNPSYKVFVLKSLTIRKCFAEYIFSIAASHGILRNLFPIKFIPLKFY